MLFNCFYLKVFGSSKIIIHVGYFYFTILWVKIALVIFCEKTESKFKAILGRKLAVFVKVILKIVLDDLCRFPFQKNIRFVRSVECQSEQCNDAEKGSRTCWQ